MVRWLYFIIGTIVLISSYFYASFHSVKVPREIVTTPYGSIDDATKSELNRLMDGYDPRRAPISILEFINSSDTLGDDVPLSWDTLCDVNNKTSLGKFWMAQYPIHSLILLNEQLHSYDVNWGKELPLIDKNESIERTVKSFFEEEPLAPKNYQSFALSPNDFELNLEENTSQLKSNSTQEFLTDDIEEYRYFKEGSLLNVSGLAHYDLRFYHSKIKEIDRIAILHRILRAWSRFTTKTEMRTWIAHGSLLGWYFNGLIMPWDDDLDVQMTSESFWKLVEFNGTLVIDYQDTVNLGKYLIDVNPWFKNRERNPENKIDARFIDLESGLYIDITFLTSEVKANEIVSDMEGKSLSEFYKVFNPYYEQIVTETEELHRQVERSINQTLSERTLISCKDYHFYTVQELSPLIPTIFEGEIVYVPNNIQNLLLREYNRKSLYLLQYKGFEYDKQKSLWTHDEIEYEYNTLMEESLNLHGDIKRTSFKRHVFKLDQLVKFEPFRVEPWIRNKYRTVK